MKNLPYFQRFSEISEECNTQLLPQTLTDRRETHTKKNLHIELKEVYTSYLDTFLPKQQT